MKKSQIKRKAALALKRPVVNKAVPVRAKRDSAAAMLPAQCKRPPRGTGKAALTAHHKAKMMGKHFRNKEHSVTALDRAIREGAHARPNMAAATLAKHFTKAERRNFI